MEVYRKQCDAKLCMAAAEPRLDECKWPSDMEHSFVEALPCKLYSVRAPTG